MYETNTINVIHLPNDPLYPHRKIREDSFLKEFEMQGIKDYTVWDGIFDEKSTIKAISRAHKRIVQNAKDNGLKRVIIAEDDLLFTDEGAWDYFLRSIPAECDMFLSHVYFGRWDDTGRLKGQFSSMTLYCVNEKFYDYFLSVSEREHIDLVMNKAWRYDIRVCLPMVCRQLPGWSDNEKSFIDRTSYEEDKPVFKTIK